MQRHGDDLFDPEAAPWSFRLQVWCVLTLIGATFGPFTTFETLSFAGRVAYWGGIIGGAILIGSFLRGAVRRLAGDSLRSDLKIALAQACLIGPLIWLLNRDVMGFDVRGWVWLLQHGTAVLAVGLLIVLVRDRSRRQGQHRGARPAAASGAEPGVEGSDDPVIPEFLHLLEPDLRGPVRRVSADDHYLHVVTNKGSGRVLMRFRDALAQLGHLDGYRIHRSHWVSDEALVRVRSEGRRHVAELSCGTELPVSAAHVEALRRAGRVG